MRRKKILLIILITFISLFYVLSNTVLGSDLINTFDASINVNGEGANEVKTKSGKIVGAIQVVGTVVSVGMLIVLGIKYVLGSADQKAEYRKSMLPYFVGAILIFGFSNITQVIYEWVKNL